MGKRLLIIAALLLAVSIGTAQAQTYPPVPALTVTAPLSAGKGMTFNITARNAKPGTVVSFTLTGPAGAQHRIGAAPNATADASGVAVSQASTPNNASTGTWTVTATGQNAASVTQTATTTMQINTSNEVVYASSQSATVAGITVERAEDVGSNDSSSSVPMRQAALAVVVLGGLGALTVSKRRTATVAAKG